jgi:hypothetical protein
VGRSDKQAFAFFFHPKTVKGEEGEKKGREEEAEERARERRTR